MQMKYMSIYMAWCLQGPSIWGDVHGDIVHEATQESCVAHSHLGAGVFGGSHSRSILQPLAESLVDGHARVRRRSYGWTEGLGF